MNSLKERSVLRALQLSGTLAVVVALPGISQVQEVPLTGKPVAALTEGLTRIAGVRELPGNKAIVADNREQKILLADFGSGNTQSIGSKGEGPNEFRNPSRVLTGPGTQTIVGDAQLGRALSVTPEGKITQTFTPPGFSMQQLAMPRAIDGTGRLYFQGSPVGAGGLVDSVAIMRWVPGAKTMDTIGMWPSGISMSNAPSSGGGFTLMRSGAGKPLSPVDLWAPLPDGRIAIVRGNPYRVDVMEGRKVREGQAIKYTPIPVTAADRDAHRAAMSNQQQTVSSFGGGASNVQMPQMAPVTDDQFPKVKPPFLGTSAVLVSPTGEIWVARTRAAEDKTPTYDILDATGRLVGRATLKPNSTVVGFGDGTVYVARQNPDDDLLYLEKYTRRG